MPDLEQRREANLNAIKTAMQGLDRVTYDTVSALLPRLLLDGALVLDASAYPPADPSTQECRGIGRYLVYDHADPENPFSIWVFALACGQKTPIHDHKYRGTVTVLDGPVSEKYYEAVGDNKARLIKRVDRYRFHSNRDDLGDAFLHQLKRRKGLGEGCGVSLHIYEMKAQRLSQDGEWVDNRNLNTIYTKDTSLDENQLPYEKEGKDGASMSV